MGKKLKTTGKSIPGDGVRGTAVLRSSVPSSSPSLLPPSPSPALFAAFVIPAPFAARPCRGCRPSAFPSASAPNAERERAHGYRTQNSPRTPSVSESGKESGSEWRWNTRAYIFTCVLVLRSLCTVEQL